MSKDLKDNKKEEKVNTEIISKENTKGNLVLFDIPDETIEQIIAFGDDAALWVKVVDGGFRANDKTVPEITGIIREIHPYLVRWENGQPDKIPDVQSDFDIPEGYERRVDLKIIVDGQIVGISLAKSSLKYHLSPYLRYLKNIELRPDNVFTKLKVKAVSNAYGTFNVVIFKMVGPANGVTSQQPQQPKPLIESEEETPPVIPSEWE